MATDPSDSTAQSSTSGSGFAIDVIEMRPSLCSTFILIFGVLTNPTVSSARVARFMRMIAAESGISGI